MLNKDTNYFSLVEAAKKMKTEDPCWEGYKMIGTKKGKGGKQVPNCVPVKKASIKESEKKMKGEDPCWEGYEMIGTKKGKGGREVPNCVPKKKKANSDLQKIAGHTFEDWANEELGEEHHRDSLEDGVLTFDEWVRDELGESEHSKMGPGFSFDDWAREESEEEMEHSDNYDDEEYDDEEYDYDDEMDEECDECHRQHHPMHDIDEDWGDYCEECEYEMSDDDGLQGECRECDADEIMQDWGDVGPNMPFMIMAKQAKKTPAWQRSEGKNKAGGLNEKGRKSYNRETGGNLKAPVTEKNPKGKRKKRRKSFCARMKGMKKKLTSKKTARDPDSRINKALRKWNC